MLFSVGSTTADGVLGELLLEGLLLLKGLMCWVGSPPTLIASSLHQIETV